MMHLEVMGSHWDGIFEEILRLYDAAGIDKGVAMTTWMPSRESNDHTRRACRQYPDRFIPFGHVRPEDDWRAELRRITQEFGWTGLKLHQGELRSAGKEMAEMRATASEIVGYAADLGIKLVKIHLSDYDAVDALSQEHPQVTWILPHMGCYFQGREMQRYCELARARPNIYLDTSAADRYSNFDQALQWAGADKITFASDGHYFSPLVEKAKIDTLRLCSPHRLPILSDDDYAMIMGGTMARLMGLA